MKFCLLILVTVVSAYGNVYPAHAQQNAQSTAPADSEVFRSKDVDQRIVVTDKEQPSYTSEARKNGISGQVVLRVIFAASGKVTNITPVQRLPYGLTEKAIETAKKIKFRPAMKNGRAVSQYMTLSFNFNLYDDEDDPRITRKAVITEQPSAEYAVEARKQRTEGTVILRVIFRRDGTIEVADVIRGLPHGLTEAAAEAAKRIKFIPAERDAEPTSIGRTMEYKFTLN